VNWLGLQPVEGTQWMVLPMGAGLADGYPGVALFLAQLGSMTGVRRYADVARRAVSPLPALLGALGGRPDLLATVGCGVAEGLAGIGYALARMSTLLDDPALGEWAEAAVRLTARLVVTGPGTEGLATEFQVTGGPAAAEPDAGWPPLPPGWLDGLAGCLAAMTAVYAETGSPVAAAAARACADRLADLVQRTGGCCADGQQPVPPGFAAGPAGIGWALARFGAVTVDPGYREAARRAVWCAAHPVAGDGGSGWCQGQAGLLVARSSLGGTGLYREARLLAQRPALRDLSLCHGEAGITEALTMLAPAQTPAAPAPTAQAPAAQPASGPAAPAPDRLPPPWRHRAGLIVDAMQRQDRFCGTPGGVATPGLLRGLAGIGYALLRAGFTERVPSVLFLEPTPRAGPDVRSVPRPAR
jgi:lantibiotic modifying enzyme